MFDQIKQEERDNIIILHLRGQFIGGDETDNLRSKLQEIAQQEKNKLILHLQNVTYLNSTALGVLISAHANFVKRGGKIVLSSVSKSIENIFVITKLTLVFPICNSIEESIKQISQ